MCYLNDVTQVTLKEIICLIVAKSCGVDRAITNLKIQKILFYIEAMFSVKYKTSFISNLNINLFEAREHGPRLQEAYDMLKTFRWENIVVDNPTNIIKDVRVKLGDSYVIIEHIIDRFIKMSDIGLEERVKCETPYKNALYSDDKLIKWQDIIEYYTDCRGY